MPLGDHNLSPTDLAVVTGATQGFQTMSPDAQAATYDSIKEIGGGASAFTRDRAIYAGGGAVLGIVLGLLFGKRKRRG